jgi:hypothetical protein
MRKAAAAFTLAVLVAVAAAPATWAGTTAGPAAAARAVKLRVALSAPGKPCRVKASLRRRLRATALLQERKRGRWRTIAHMRLARRRAVTLRCDGAAASVRRFRVLVRRRGRIIARSRVVLLRARRATPPAGPGPTPPVPGPEPPDPLPSEPLDPAQFGVEGTGGLPGLETFALLADPNVVLDATQVADLQAGRVDPRVVSVLEGLAEEHVITVGALSSDGPRFDAGGAVSMHYLGRAVDIARVDGAPVSAGNDAARALAGGLASLGPAYRPDEVGTPWPIPAPGYFSDASTQTFIHIGFKQPIDPGWTPPPD